MAPELSSARVVGRYTVEYEEHDRLILRASRTGVVLGATILFACAAGPAALGTGLIETTDMPIVLRLFALGLALVLLYAGVAMAVNWIRVKDRILFDRSAGRISFEGPLAQSPVEFAEIERLELRDRSLAGAWVYDVVVRCGQHREIVIDKSSDLDRMRDLAQKVAAVTVVPLSENLSGRRRRSREREGSQTDEVR
jgi:hypothetical protein